MKTPDMKAGAAVELAGEPGILRPERALWLPERSTLVVADLHVGKEAAFRAAGLAVPEGILDETLARLGALAAALAARRVVVAGDLVHARRGLTGEVVARVAAWRATVGAAIDLVRGNHDRHAPRLPASWSIGEAGDELALGPLRIRHEPPAGGDGDAGFTVTGHLHPTVLLRGGGDRLRLPCFVLDPTGLVLPAFTRFARGAPADPAPGRRIYAIAGDETVEVDPAGPAARGGGGSVCAATIDR